MAVDPWDPEQYERFGTERSRPFYDLLDLVRPQPGMRVLDLGCGTGELTRELHGRLGAASTLGVDSSPAMLQKSREFEGGGVSFLQEDIGRFTPEDPADLVFSNAALHWIPDHKSLLPRLCRFVSSSGQLAIQVPANEDQPSHTVARRLAREEPFAGALKGFVHRSPVLSPEEYARLLWQGGLKDLHVRLQVYTHELDSPREIVEWVKGSLLTAYKKRLPPELYDEFLARYVSGILREVEGRSPFLFAYKRILIWGRRTSEDPTAG